MRELIVKNQPLSPVSEAYRAIRTNLLFANVDKQCQSIIVTSATAGEGKTTTLCNLAMTLVDSGKRVVIIDCDLRKPRIHKFFNISNKAGITDVLLNNEPYTKFVYQEIHANLHVIPSGKIPANPSELMASNAMRSLIRKLESDYDYVFIDTPPVLPVTDAAVLSNIAHGVILVCRSGVVKFEMAKKAKHKLVSVNAHLLGVVLNGIEAKNKEYQYYYTYKATGESTA